MVESIKLLWYYTNDILCTNAERGGMMDEKQIAAMIWLLAQPDIKGDSPQKILARYKQALAKLNGNVAPAATAMMLDMD